MQMRPGHASGRTGESKELSTGNHHAALYIDPRKVCIERIHAQTVIENNGVAREEQIFRQYNAAAVRRMDGRSCCCEQIGTCMWGSRLSVENAAVAEVRSSFTGNRDLEKLVPEHLVTDDRVDCFGLFFFAVCAREGRPAAFDASVI